MKVQYLPALLSLTATMLLGLSTANRDPDMNGPAPALIRQARPQSVLLANELPLVQAGLIEICRSNLEHKVAGLVWDGEKAWRLIEERLPDIAVVDLRLSLRSGLEIAQSATQAKLSTKIIILAANSDREMLTACLRVGVRAFLLESASSDEFLEAFRQVAAGGIYISRELNLLESLSRSRLTVPDALSMLPHRQFQVLSLLVEGFPTNAIASRLKLSPATVAMHRAKLMRKLDIHSVAGLVKFVFDRKPELLGVRR
jgi:DNA-binding NarL/FixJ family response regulator